MSDKMRRTFPVEITFVDGERPTSNKVSGIATQARNGLGIIESAMADIWNQSGDEFLSDGATDSRRTLNIPSVGRVLGTSDSLSPYFDFLDVVEIPTFSFFDNTANFVNLHEMPLSLLADGNLEETTGAKVPEATTLANDATGEWYYDPETNKIFCYDAADDFADINYDVAATSIPTHDDVFSLTPNVIPPAAQSTGFTGCKVVAHATEGYYYIILPPRQRLSGREDVVVYPGAGSADDNLAVSAADDLLWWDEFTAAPALGANNDEHYRYRLPSLIDSLTWGDMIPDGFIRLSVDDRVMDGIIFYRPSDALYQYSYVLLAYAPYCTALENLAAADTGTHASTNYQTGVKIITSGASVAEVVAQNRRMILNHSHTSASVDGFSSRVKHADLVKLDPPYNNGYDYGDAYEGYWPFGTKDVRLLRSNWRNDDHLQYVHRGGSIGDGVNADKRRDIYNNAFLGDLLIGSTVQGTAPYYNNVSGASNKIYFGSMSSGPYLYYNQATYAAITAVGVIGTSYAVYGLATSTGHGVGGSSTATDKAGLYGINTHATGYGVWGTNNAGHGVYGHSAAASKGAVYGLNSAAGAGYGVYGVCDNAAGDGVYGSSANGTGVYGYSNAASKAAVSGYNANAGGWGVLGESLAGDGVYGSSISGNGVKGVSTASYGGYFTGNATYSPIHVEPSGAPASGVPGDIYADATGDIYVYITATGWKKVTRAA